MNNKRFINLRPLGLLALSFIAGILCAYAASKGYFWVFYLSLGLAICGVAVFFVFKKIRQAIVFLLAVIFGVLGFINFNFAAKRITADEYHGEEVSITANLTDNIVFYNTYAFVTLRDFEVTKEGSVKKYSNGVIGCYINYTQQINADTLKESAGFFVEMDCVLYNSPIFSDGVNTYYVKNKIYFLAERVKNFTLNTGRSTFDEKARGFIKETFYTQLSEETAPVAVALVLGDKSGMDPVLTSGYRNMGVSHIFAVSGLHVGFIAAVLAFLARTLRLNKWLVSLFTFTLMLFYAWLCGFSASVVRALIMVACGLMGINLGVKNDSLSNISLAALIILIIQPLFIFDVGFLLSFGAVIGINCITSALNRKTAKVKKPLKNVLSLLFLSGGAMIGVFGLMGHFFGSISLLGLGFNMLMVPLIFVCFVVLLIGLLPFFNFVLIMPKFILAMSNYVAVKLSTLKLGIIELESIGYVLVLYFLAIFIIGGYVNLPKKTKITCVSVLLGICIAFNIYLIFPKKLNYQVNCFDVYSGQCFALTGDKRNAYIVSNLAYTGEINNILDFCLDFDIENVSFFMTDYSQTDTDYLQTLLVYGINIEGVYICLPHVNAVKDQALKDMNISKFALSANYSLTFGEIKAICLRDGGSGGWFFEVKNTNLLFLPNLTQNNYRRLISCAPNAADIIFCNEEVEFVKHHSGASVLVTNKFIFEEGIFSHKVLGNFTIKLNNDKITIIP